jgi:hypothetical protein
MPKQAAQRHAPQKKPPARPGLLAERRRALELLASSPHGASEERSGSAMAARRHLLAGPAAEGEVAMVGSRAIEVVRIRITGAGRGALAAED